MKRAVELFDFQERRSSSELVTRTWWTHSEPEPSFISSAEAQWEMVVTRQRGAAWLSVRGPEARASEAPIPQDAEFFGVSFSLGTYMPDLPLRQLVDRSVTLPATSGRFWLDGTAWELPTPDNADVFVDRLVRAGLLAFDPVAAALVSGDSADSSDSADEGLSIRAVERRVKRATGLTRGTIRQIRRAKLAVSLLEQGKSAGDVARAAGYADQPHLTRSLKRYVGLTPSQITVRP